MVTGHDSFPAPYSVGQELLISGKWAGTQKFESEVYKTLLHKGIGVGVWNFP